MALFNASEYKLKGERQRSLAKGWDKSKLWKSAGDNSSLSLLCTNCVRIPSTTQPLPSDKALSARIYLTFLQNMERASEATSFLCSTPEIHNFLI